MSPMTRVMACLCATGQGTKPGGRQQPPTVHSLTKPVHPTNINTRGLLVPDTTASTSKGVTHRYSTGMAIRMSSTTDTKYAPMTCARKSITLLDVTEDDHAENICCDRVHQHVHADAKGVQN